MWYTPNWQEMAARLWQTPAKGVPELADARLPQDVTPWQYAGRELSPAAGAWLDQTAVQTLPGLLNSFQEYFRHALHGATRICETLQLEGEQQRLQAIGEQFGGWISRIVQEYNPILENCQREGEVSGEASLTRQLAAEMSREMPAFANALRDELLVVTPARIDAGVEVYIESMQTRLARGGGDGEDDEMQEASPAPDPDELGDRIKQHRSQLLNLCTDLAGLEAHVPHVDLARRNCSLGEVARSALQDGLFRGRASVAGAEAEAEAPVYAALPGWLARRLVSSFAAELLGLNWHANTHPIATYSASDLLAGLNAGEDAVQSSPIALAVEAAQEMECEIAASFADEGTLRLRTMVREETNPDVLQDLEAGMRARLCHVDEVISAAGGSWGLIRGQGGGWITFTFTLSLPRPDASEESVLGGLAPAPEEAEGSGDFAGTLQALTLDVTCEEVAWRFRMPAAQLQTQAARLNLAGTVLGAKALENMGLPLELVHLRNVHGEGRDGEVTLAASVQAACEAGRIDVICTLRDGGGAIELPRALYLDHGVARELSALHDKADFCKVALPSFLAEEGEDAAQLLAAVGRVIESDSRWPEKRRSITLEVKAAAPQRVAPGFMLLSDGPSLQLKVSIDSEGAIYQGSFDFKSKTFEGSTLEPVLNARVVRRIEEALALADDVKSTPGRCLQALGISLSQCLQEEGGQQWLGAAFLERGLSAPPELIEGIVLNVHSLAGSRSERVSTAMQDAIRATIEDLYDVQELDGGWLRIRRRSSD